MIGNIFNFNKMIIFVLFFSHFNMIDVLKILGFQVLVLNNNEIIRKRLKILIIYDILNKI